jgi:hypothetical protein
MAISNRLANATKNYLAPKAVEGVLTGNVGLSYFLVRSKRGAWKGAQVEVPFKHSKNTNGSSFNGFDTLSTSAVDNTIKLTYDAKFNEIPVVLPKTDLSLNETEEQVADLMERQMASDASDLADNLGTQFYGDGTGNSGKDILGLGAIVDDGTSVTTIGGQSRSTYTGLQGTVTASGGTMTLAQLYTLWDNVSEGSQEPDLILTTKTIRSLYNQLLDANERYTVPMSPRDKFYMTTGAEQLAFRSAPVVADSKCPAGKLFMLNSNSFKFHALKRYEGAEAVNLSLDEMSGTPSPDVPKGLGFFWTGWTRPTNQEAIVGRMVHAGNFVADNPRYNGVLTGVTGI